MSSYNLVNLFSSPLLSLAQFKRTNKKLIGKNISEFEHPSVFNCFNDCFEIKDCYGVETSLIESSNQIKCVFKDSSDVSNEIDDNKENFILDGELFTPIYPHCLIIFR